ncbi:MAG: UDP-3-O-[3-hydroxymyristoyl] N-acetylglucosamine deacetylase [Planctomycetes bacterium]|nr:UDP-3-O-[3-hydroxymyristoyl] N-acetylglucosamine deacetylase [Planctomycetota bacterium]
MYAPRQQRTIARSAVVAGYGYWSGSDVTVEFRPAPPDSGVTFVRRDLGPAARIPATVAHRIDAQRRTVLRAGGVSVEMVEHIMAALFGLHVDNCEVWVDAPEMPGCDGSSQAFVEALTAAEFVAQPAIRRALVVRETTRLGTADCWIEARPNPAGALSLKFHLDYGPGNSVGRQTLALPVTIDSFRRELAPSRTFLLKSEADWLVSQGLGKRTTPRDLLIFDTAGPIDNELRYHDECVRHKSLDLVGDLALAGCDLIGHFVAYRSGHRLNADLVRTLLSEVVPTEIRRTA